MTPHPRRPHTPRPRPAPHPPPRGHPPRLSRAPPRDRRRGQLMKVHDLQPSPGAKTPRRRVGRGIAGKGGKTAGRGTKGQGARNNIKPGFEGGQLPLAQRIPKLKGFNNPFRVEYVVVNLDTLADFEGDEVSPETLRAKGLVHKHGLVKV